MTTIDNALFAEIVASSSQGMLVVEASGDFLVVYANRAYQDAIGYPAEEMIGTPWLRYAAADEGSELLAEFRAGVDAGKPVTLRLPFLRLDGELWQAKCRLSPLETGSGSQNLVLIEHLADAGDTSHSKESRLRSTGVMRRLVVDTDRYDALTGLLSGNEFRLMLRRDIAIARRNGQPVHLMMFSVPEFEAYRETFGSNAAESCLRMISAQIEGVFRRASDLSARVGDALFAVSVVGQDDEQVSQLVSKVESKGRGLGLHNPRARSERHIVVYGAMVELDSSVEDVERQMDRCLRLLTARSDPDGESIVRMG